MSFKTDTAAPLFLLALWAFFISLPLAWLTHVYVCLVAGKWGFLIAGALVFPIAIIHGYGVWLGLW